MKYSKVRPIISARGYAADEKVDWIGSLAFFGVHAACFLPLYYGVTWTAFFFFVFSYSIRMFAITAGFHRYFAHRSYQTSRLFQFLLAFVGTCSSQMGPLWWAAHHRDHHRYSDTDKDIHSPILRGFWWAHLGWVVCKKYSVTKIAKINDFARFPELRWLNKYHVVVSVAYAVFWYYLGYFLHAYNLLNVTAMQSLIWGYFVATVFLYHGTFSINSLAHVWGTRRFETSDFSRNNFFLALITFGEGWHNNHHRYPYSEKQGIAWYEVDFSHIALKILSWPRIVWGVRTIRENEAEENAA